MADHSAMGITASQVLPIHKGLSAFYKGQVDLHRGEYPGNAMAVALSRHIHKELSC